MTQCAHRECENEVVQPKTGRKRKFCSIECQKDAQRIGYRVAVTPKARNEALRAWR